MQNFMETLTSESKNEKLPEEFNFFGKLIGSWNINYVDNSTSKVMKGEWHFSWVLEGFLPKSRTIIFIGRMLQWQRTVNGMSNLTYLPIACDEHVVF